VKLLLLALLFCLRPVPAHGQPDFSQSVLSHEPTQVREGDVVTFSAVIRNSGSEPAPFTEVTFALPWESLFVDLDGLPEATVDHAEETVDATVSLPPNSERRFRVRVVVPQDAGGKVLRPSLRARYLHRDVSFEAGEPIDIDTAPRRGGVRLGGVRLGAVEFALLAVLALYPTLWMVLPRRRRSHGSVAAIVLGAGFLTIFIGLGWRDWQTLTRWREGRCEILDTRLKVETELSRIRIGQTPRRTENRNYNALLALRYEVDGEELISTGYDTGTRLAVGTGARQQQEFAQWKIGSTVPCWFDPETPHDVIAIRGFGGAYAFALLPLGVLALGIASATRWGSR
jgi:hypothetical protein